MKLEKAIEILTHLKEATNSATRQECEVAYQLGIEALKLIDDWRNGQELNLFALLLGETEE